MGPLPSFLSTPTQVPLFSRTVPFSRTNGRRHPKRDRNGVVKIVVYNVYHSFRTYDFATPYLAS